MSWDDPVQHVPYQAGRMRSVTLAGSGTFNVPSSNSANIRRYFVFGAGGGSGGGGGQGGTGGSGNAHGGNGGFGVCPVLIPLDVSPGDAIAYAVGAAGTGGTGGSGADGNPGNVGVATTFGSLTFAGADQVGTGGQDAFQAAQVNIPASLGPFILVAGGRGTLNGGTSKAGNNSAWATGGPGNSAGAGSGGGGGGAGYGTGATSGTGGGGVGPTPTAGAAGSSCGGGGGGGGTSGTGAHGGTGGSGMLILYWFE